MLIVVDPGLVSAQGHSLTYDQLVAEQMAFLGEQSVVLAPRHVTVTTVGPAPVLPCFRYDYWATEPPSVLRSAFLADLRRTVVNARLPVDATYFLPTVTYRQISAALDAISSQPLLNARLILFLRLAISANRNVPDARALAAYRNALSLIPGLRLQDRVRLVTDSELLAEEYAAVTDLPIQVVPIPSAEPRSAPRLTPPGTPPNVVYLGSARASKGFHYLPHLVSRLRPLLAAGTLTAEFQANVETPHETQAIEAIRALRREPVTLWENEMALDAYDALLERASLVICPHQTLCYHAQTSGPFAEALGRGKPVIAARGTWMAREVRRTKAGLLFAPGDRADFAETTLRAIESLPELRESARRAQAEWAARHNARALVENLLAVWD